MQTSLAVFGGGRMGRAIALVCDEVPEADLVAVVSRTRPDWLNATPWCADLSELPASPKLLLDFSLPDGTTAAAKWCRAHAVPLVSGVTGLNESAQTALQKTAEMAPVLWGANMGLGVNVLAELARSAAAMLGSATAVEILDIHHQWKKDAPSGTALMLGAQVDAGRADDAPVIAYKSIREGEVIGEHRIGFQLENESITLSHTAQDRAVFASGALQAGLWLVSQPPGLYSPADWVRQSQTRG